MQQIIHASKPWPDRVELFDAKRSIKQRLTQELHNCIISAAIANAITVDLHCTDPKSTPRPFMLWIYQGWKATGNNLEICATPSNTTLHTLKENRPKYDMKNQGNIITKHLCLDDSGVSAVVRKLRKIAFPLFDAAAKYVTRFDEVKLAWLPIEMCINEHGKIVITRLPKLLSLRFYAPMADRKELLNTRLFINKLFEEWALESLKFAAIRFGYKSATNQMAHSVASSLVKISVEESELDLTEKQTEEAAEISSEDSVKELAEVPEEVAKS